MWSCEPEETRSIPASYCYCEDCQIYVDPKDGCEHTEETMRNDYDCIDDLSYDAYVSRVDHEVEEDLEEPYYEDEDICDADIDW